ncbi:MAG: TIGR02147 family protein [Candidatus Poribacteria bacterium]
MEKDLFDYTDYRQYLLDWMGSLPKRGRGIRASVANGIRCPISHISQVLKGKTDFTFEQAEEVNDFLGHTREQAEYFLFLVQLARAGTPKLRNRIELQIQKIREKRFILKDRLDVKASISKEEQATFYSSWLYAAVHILLTIEQYQTKEAIAKYFAVSPKKIAEILEFLERLGLATHEQGRFVASTSRLHLGHDSPMIVKHHINWRLQTIRSLEREDASESLHYSSVVSISKNDVSQIKSLLVKAIEGTKSIIRDSKEEELHSFCLDFFKI